MHAYTQQQRIQENCWALLQVWSDLPMTPSVSTGTVAINKRLSLGSRHILNSPMTMPASWLPAKGPQGVPQLSAAQHRVS